MNIFEGGQYKWTYMRGDFHSWASEDLTGGWPWVDRRSHSIGSHGATTRWLKSILEKPHF